MHKRIQERGHIPPEPSQPSLLVSVDDAAQTLGIGRSTLYKILAGQVEGVHIRPVKIGKRTLIPRAAIEQFAAELVGDTTPTLTADARLHLLEQRA